LDRDCRTTGSQSEAAQVATLRKHGAGKVFREVAQGDKTVASAFNRSRVDRASRSSLVTINASPGASWSMARCSFARSFPA